MDTRDSLRIGCPRCGALPGCFCKSLVRRCSRSMKSAGVRRRARGRKSPAKGPRENRRIVRRRLIRLLLSLSLLALVSAAQDGTSAPGQSPSGAASKSGTSKSIEGCLTSSNGSYTLGTRSGDLYRLENSGHDLRKYTDQEVRITGRVTPPHPGSSPSNVLDQQYAKLKVQKIKKVFDTCQ